MSNEAVIASNKRRAKHGMCHSSVYLRWAMMHQRCSNPKDARYPRYGGRGIRVCKRWKSFQNFYADMGDPPKGTTLNRINNNGDYKPSNCQWTTVQRQQNNMRTNVLVTYRGKKQSLADWARELQLPYHWLVYRNKIGRKPPELFDPVNHKGEVCKYLVEFNGKTMTVREYAASEGIHLATAYWRLNAGKLNMKAKEKAKWQI